MPSFGRRRQHYYAPILIGYAARLILRYQDIYLELRRRFERLWL